MAVQNILKSCKEELLEIEKTPALSCVEYYFIPWMKQFFSIEKLYPQTIFSYTQAERVILNSSFENPIGIPRIQEIAEQKKLVVHKKNLFNGESPKKDELLLLRVNDYFFQGNQIAWRKDHYVRLMAVTKNKYFIVNNYPMEVREKTIKDGKWMQGECLIFKFLGGEVIPEACRFYSEEKNLQSTITMLEFRNILLLYRVCLKRLQACFPKDEILKKLISHVEMIFFRCALATKKNPQDMVLASLWRSDILKAEAEYKEMVK